MAKRRRKLSKEHELHINSSLKEVELYTAKINDIRDDDIREEYLIAFSQVKMRVDILQKAYKEIGFDDRSISLLENYTNALRTFINEYEI